MKTLFEVPEKDIDEGYSENLIDTCLFCDKSLDDEREYWEHMLKNGTMPNRIEIVCSRCGGKNVVNVLWKPYFKVP
jgi:hypothetical protein